MGEDCLRRAREKGTLGNPTRGDRRLAYAPPPHRMCGKMPPLAVKEKKEHRLLGLGAEAIGEIREQALVPKRGHGALSARIGVARKTERKQGREAVVEPLVAVARGRGGQQGIESAVGGEQVRGIRADVRRLKKRGKRRDLLGRGGIGKGREDHPLGHRAAISVKKRMPAPRRTKA